MKHTCKILTALALCVMMTMTLFVGMLTVDAAADTPVPWDGTVATEYAGGDGTEANPYLIATAAQLAKLSADSCNNGAKNEFCYKLTADIDLNNIPFLPIGIRKIDGGYGGTCYFQGVFDGDGHTIVNLKIAAQPDGTPYEYSGLFGTVRCGTVKNFSLICSETNTLGNMSGLLVGMIHHNSGSLEPAYIQNVYVKGDVVAVGAYKHGVGGAIGRTWGKLEDDRMNYIENVVYEGTVSAPECLNVGGIVGQINTDSNLTVKNCLNLGTINGKQNVGGIIGLSDPVVNQTIIVENCLNLGAVSATEAGNAYQIYGSVAGEIVKGSTVTLKNCYGTAEGNVDVWGFKNRTSFDDKSKATIADVTGSNAKLVATLGSSWTARKEGVMLPTELVKALPEATLNTIAAHLKVAAVETTTAPVTTAAPAQTPATADIGLIAAVATLMSGAAALSLRKRK